MARYGRIGRFGQIAHPRIRGDLDPSHEKKRFRKGRVVTELVNDEETYFVPSISIRRHLHRDEEETWNMQRKLLQRRLGRSFATVPSSEVSLKVVEQHRLIKNVRAAGIRPEPEEVRDIAYAIRDGLTNLLTSARSPLEVPLGNFGRFGYKNNAVAYELGGWRGERATYGLNDSEGFMDTHAVLRDERQLAVGAIALAFERTDFRVEGISPNPHMTIARAKEAIPDHRMREIRGELGELALEDVKLSDPVIEVKLYRDEPPFAIPIRHSWQSLGPDLQGNVPKVETAVEFDFDKYDHYENLALH